MKTKKKDNFGVPAAKAQRSVSASKSSPKKAPGFPATPSREKPVFHSIWDLEQYAKDAGFNTVRFEFDAHNGLIIKARWLDAYYGFIQLDGHDGFMTSKQLGDCGYGRSEFRVI